MKYYIIKDALLNPVLVTKTRYYYIKKHGGCYDEKFIKDGKKVRIQYEYKNAPGQMVLDL